ncbi:MAG: peptidylprolyl isomerase [Rhodobacterales bacterium]|nr:peptidylprolyl isomerase [Rhodobacterales bacterium]
MLSRLLPPALALTLALAGAVGGGPRPAAAQEAALHIAAVVNDDAISAYDLYNRLTIVMVSSNVPNRPEIRERLAPQVLRNLIDEKLKLQEAKRLGIEIPETEVDRALARLETRNKLPPGGLDNYLASEGINKANLIAQIRAELAWVRVVSRTFRSKVSVTPEEIKDALARMDANAGKPEYAVAEIFLPVDQPEQEGETRNLARRLMQQISQGASFPSLARSFSQNAAASKGGDLGWVSRDDLDGPVADLLEKMQPGQISGPARSDAGYHILFLRQKRIAASLDDGATVTLKQLVLPLAASADAATQAETRDRLTALAAKATDCDAMDALAKETGSPLSGTLGTVPLSGLAPAMKAAVGDLKVGTPSAPLPVPDGLAVLMVCERTDMAQEEREKRVEDMLLERRLSQRADRLLRDLRRAAFIDIRI